MRVSKVEVLERGACLQHNRYMTVLQPRSVAKHQDHEGGPPAGPADVIKSVGMIGRGIEDAQRGVREEAAAGRDAESGLRATGLLSEEGIHFYLQDKSLMHLYLTHLHKLE